MKSVYYSLFYSLFILPFSLKSLTNPLQGTFSVLGHKNGIAFFDHCFTEKDVPKVDFSIVKAVDKITPLGEKVNLNNHPDYDNPLVNKSLRLITFFGSSPLIVTHDQPNTVYCVSVFDKSNKGAIKSFDILDENKKPVEIVGLGSNIVDHQDKDHSYVFTAVKKPEVALGTHNSAIVRTHMKTVTHQNEVTKKDEYTTSTFEVKDFLPLRLHSSALSWNGSLRSINNDIDNPVCFHWSQATQRLYVGFSVTTGPEENNGGCALAMIRLFPFKMYKIIPFTALQGTDHIIGAQGPNITISVHKLDSMITHTHFPYLIMVGGVGEKEVTQSCVYAFPLVSNTPRYTGTIVQQTLITHQTAPNFPFRWLNRYLSLPVQEMYTAFDPRVQVGGGSLGAPITDLEVKGDALFVSTSGSNTTEPGVYHSQALCNAEGTIKQWTQWKKVAGNNKAVTHCWHNAQDELCFCEVEDQKRTICQLEWAKNARINTFLEKVFAKEDHPQGIIGYCETIINEEPHLVVTGKGTVVVFKSDANGYPVEKGYAARDGSLRTFAEEDTIIFSGPVLEEVGLIKTATYASYYNQSWLIVGGEKGVAVLQDHHGNGFNTTFNRQLAFKKFGSFEKVRKIIFDEGMLYILTNTSLERIAIKDNWIVAPERVEIAHAHMNNQEYAFFDCIISRDSALLATHCGLLKAENNIRLAENCEQASWTSLDLGDSEGPFTHLYAVCPTYQETDVARGWGGTVYAINNSIVLKKSRIYRIDMHEGRSIVPCADYWLGQKASCFFSMPMPCTFVTTDGMSWLATLKSARIPWMLRVTEVMNGKHYFKTIRKPIQPDVGKAARFYYSLGFKKWILLEPYNLYIYE